MRIMIPKAQGYCGIVLDKISWAHIIIGSSTWQMLNKDELNKNLKEI